MTRRRLGLALLTLAVACAKPPPVLRGPVTVIGVRQAQQQDMTGTRIRWGGRLVSTTPEAQRTCFEIVGAALDRRARPIETDISEGRFIACARGFYDPEVFSPKREVTVTGVIEGRTAGKVGEADYEFPRVAADVVYLWPERRERAVVYPAFPYGGWWGYPYWYGGYGPYRHRRYRRRGC